MTQQAGVEPGGQRGGLSPGEAARHRGSAGGRTAVLLVDDIAENLFAMSALLRRDDVELLTARSGREALELLLDRRVALAVLDVQMPELDGFELATLMRGVEATRHVPIIFVTAMPSDERRVFTGYEAGAVDFLFKPIDPHVLKSKVDVFVTLEHQRQELRRSEERFRTLVEATSQAIWRLTPDGAVAEDSPSFRELTGLEVRDWLEGRWMNVIHPEDRDRVTAAWQEAQRTRTASEVEYRIRRPEGHFTWTLARVAPVLGDRGELVEWIGANTDIAPRKEAENLRETFMAILGHDLRTPLSAMLTSTQLVLRRNQEQSVRQPLQRVLSSGERMVRMIDQLLDLTRVRLGGGFELSPVVADLGAVVCEALSEAAKGSDRYVLETTGDLKGSWDVDRVFQIITNLACNAAEHGAPETKVRVFVDGSAREVVRLSVHNLGGAIPEELRPVMFEPFRGSKQRKVGGGQGLGLGLFITSQLVQAHGGSIGFESSAHAGTVFKVSLPRYVRVAEPPES